MVVRSMKLLSALALPALLACSAFQEGSSEGDPNAAPSESPSTDPSTDRSDDGSGDDGSGDDGSGDDGSSDDGSSEPGEDPSEEPGGDASNDGSFCYGDLASRTFRYGLCVCEGWSKTGQLTTSSFRSSDPSAAEGEGGGVGVNGTFSSSGLVDIGGSLVVAGQVSSAANIQVAAELRVGGDVAVTDLQVQGDAYVEGSITGGGLRVEGTLHTPTALPAWSGVEAGATEVSSFHITPPCDCEEQIDIAGFVAEAAVQNDNEAASLSADAFDGIHAQSSLTLPPGRYYLSRIHSLGEVELRLSGPTALFVDGGVLLSDRFEVVLETETAVLDLFIRESLLSTNALELGSTQAPARVRTYVGGDGSIVLANTANFSGALYAPNAGLRAVGELEFSGAVLVRDIADGGDMSIRYDADLIEAHRECPAEEPTEPAEPTGDDAPPDEEEPSGGGLTGDACVTFEDCVSPLACLGGTCQFIGG